jgi:acyl-CoA reductase-like NAD-dependent aldehyde dehydrogenase
MSWKLAPCLVAGNAVVLKPSPLTPFSTISFADLTRNLLPNGLFNVIIGDADVGSALVQNPDVGMISFTGSTTVGKEIGVECARQLKPCTLELGGKNAVIVFNDVDIERVLDSVVDGAFCITC